MRICLCLVLFFILTTTLSAQEKTVIRLGDGNSPVLPASEFDLQSINGTSSFQLDSHKSRAIEFTVLEGNGEVTCHFSQSVDDDAQTLQLNVWYRIQQPTDCFIFSPKAVKIQLNVAQASSDYVDLLPPADPRNNWQLKRIDPRLPVLQADINFGSSQSHAVAFILASVLLILLVVGAVLAYRIFWEKKTHWPVEEPRITARLAEASSMRMRDSPEPKIVVTSPPEPLPAPEPSSELAQIRTEVEMLAREQQKLADQMTTAVMKELHDTADDLRGALRRLESAQDKSFIQLHDELNECRQRLVIQESTIQQLQSSRSESLKNTLKDMTQGYFKDGSRAQIAERMDNAVTDYLSEPPPSTELSQCRARAKALAAAIESLLAGMTPPSQELVEKLNPFADQFRQMEAEITDLLSACSESFHMQFGIEFKHSNRTESLISGIAEGVQKQVAKLDSPVEHFDYQLQVLAANAAQTAADFLDSSIDLDRSNDHLQKLLNDLLQAGGLEQISPALNEDFSAREHSMVRMVPRPAGINRGPSVARLVFRGFRRGKDVLRPASVILYE